MAEAKYTVGFKVNHINDGLLKKILMKIDTNAKLCKWSTCTMSSANSDFLSKMLSKENNSRIVGFLKICIEYTLPECEQVFQKYIVFKSKTRGHEKMPYRCDMAPFSDNTLLDVWRESICKYGWYNNEYTELQCVNMTVLHPVMPEIYWSWVDESRDIFVFAMEYIDPDRFTHIDCFADPSIWKEQDIAKVLSGMAKVHAVHYGMPLNEDKSLHSFNTRSGKYLLECKPAMCILLEQVHPNSPDLLNEKEYAYLLKVLERFDKVTDIINSSPNTVVHYDMWARNLCIRKDPIPGKHFLCLYDWETTCIAPPQIDLAQFLNSVVPENTPEEIWNKYVNMYVSFLKKELGSSVDKGLRDHLQFNTFVQVFDMCMIERLLHLHLTFISIMQKTAHVKRFINIGLQYIRTAAYKYDFL